MTSKVEDNKSNYWTVEVIEPLPHCKSAKAAYDILASPTKWKEWRSSKVAQIKSSPAPGVSEPVGQGDEWYFHPTFFMTFSNRALEARVEDDLAVLDVQGNGFCGCCIARLKFTVYQNDKGEWMGKAQEKHIKGKWMFPSHDVIEGEHRTMYQELDKVFAQAK